MRVAHLTTVDLSLRYLVLPQMTGVIALGGEAIGVSAYGPYVDELQRLGIRHITLPGATRSVDPIADLTAMIALWRILRKERPDVIHTHTPKPGLYGRVIGRIAGVPAVLNTVHGLYATPDDPVMKRTIVYALEAFAARFSDVELIQSTEDFRLVTERHITRPGRTVLLGNGVDLMRFDPELGSPDERRSTRAVFGADDDQIVIGVVGRLVGEKGYIELFDAVEGLDNRFKLVVIGPHEPDKADAIDDRTVAAARAAGVAFLGMRDDVDVLYRGMDLFVLPSHREGFPRAAMEAAASGLPLIVTDIRGCREVVEDGVNGLLVPVRDPEALRSAIAKLGGDAELRKRMSQTGRSKATREFDEQRVVRTVIESQVRALRENGYFERLGNDAHSIRPAEPRDARIVARIHAHRSQRPKLTVGILTRVFRRLIAAPEGIVWIAADDYGPFAYIAGVSPTSRTRNRFSRIAVSGHLGFWQPETLIRPRRPANIQRRWGRSPTGEYAEVLSMGVAVAFEDSEVCEALVNAFLQSIAERGGRCVKTVADPTDVHTIDMLESLGFAPSSTADHEASPTELWAQIS